MSEVNSKFDRPAAMGFLERTWAFVGFLVAVAITVSSCGLSHGQETKESLATVRVSTATSSPASIIELTGTVHAKIESDLGFRVPGQITQRFVDPGQTVHRGQPLLRLDDANLALALGAAQERLQATEADFVRAHADEERLHGLVDADAISRSVYDTALAASRAAAANEHVATLAVRDAQLNRHYATLVADSDGVVLEVLAQPGQVVGPGAPVVRLAHAGTREALATIPETLVTDLPADGSATGYGETRSNAAHLREVAGAADAFTRTFAARYTLEGASIDLPLGSTVTLRLSQHHLDAVRVPLSALYDPGTGPGIWVVQGHEVQFRLVKVSALSADSADIETGAVEPGEEVVALGAQRLRLGTHVRAEHTSS